MRTISVVLILSLVVALALVMLLSRQAVNDRTEQVESDLGTTVTVSPAGARGFQGGGDPLSAADVQALRSLANVRDASSTLTDQVRTQGSTVPNRLGATSATTGETSLQSPIRAGAIGGRQGNAAGATGAASPAGGGAGGPGGGGGGGFLAGITVTGTTAPDDAEVLGVSELKLVSGSFFDGAGRDRSALVGSTLASANQLTPGSAFTAYGATLTVAGVFDAGNTFANGGIIMPLATLQELSSQPDAVTTVILRANSMRNVASISAAVQDLFGTKVDVVSDAANADLTLTSLRGVRSLAGYSLAGALFAGAVIIFLSMLMIVRERRREIGVLKAIGAPTSRITTQFAAESLAITLIAAVIGIVIGVVMSNPVLDLMLNNTAAAQQPVVQVAGLRGNIAPGAAGPGAGGPAAAGPLAAAAAQGRTGGRATPASVGRGVTQFTSALDDVRTTGGVAAIGYGALAAVVIALLGSVVPSVAIAGIRPAEVMRSE